MASTESKKKENSNGNPSRLKGKLNWVMESNASHLFYCFLACLWQKAFTLARPSWRRQDSTAKVMRSQFFIPTALPGPASSVLCFVSLSNGNNREIPILPGRIMTDSKYALCLKTRERSKK
ncbi:hypothetical protein V6N13_134859 [Hibiscus sabdariffa]|uniref:Uncharacterized protein n=1 Tax=Hibiscus sabdariffa TaxID=183260 RepID=A0ABR2R502_9ROSI